MKFTTATALFVISASVASAAPAYTQVPIVKAATTISSSVEQPSIVLDYYTVSSASSTKIASTAAVVSILPVGQASIFLPSGISVHISVPTTVVSNGKTTTSEVQSVSFLRFGPGPARVSPLVSTTASSISVASTSTPAIMQLQAQSTSSGLPFTLHFGFPAQATVTKSSTRSAASSSCSSAPSASTSSLAHGFSTYKSTVYSTIYAKPSTIVVQAPKSTVTSIVSVPGTKHTVYQTVYHTPTVASSSVKSAVTPVVRNLSTASSSALKVSTSTSVGLPFTLHYGFPMQHSTLVTSVIKSTPVAASYSTTSFIKSTPIAAYTSATPTTKKSYV